MPPKRDLSNANCNNSSNYVNNELPTTPFTPNKPEPTTSNIETNATTYTAAIENASSNTLSSISTTAAGVANTLPVTAADPAAELRTVAYHANAKLCRLVRKCPWMYDRNHRNYARKHILDKSWCKIAKECNDSAK